MFSADKLWIVQFCFFFVPLILALASAQAIPNQHKISRWPDDNNWAVIVCTSRYWFNYRHLANALTIYNIVKTMGIPDERIIFMNALSGAACNSRNPLQGTILNIPDSALLMPSDNLYANVSTDYDGMDVNVENFIRLLTGRHPPETPLSRRLLTNSDSRILMFLSGHGGDEFLKFHDYEEISAQDIGYTLTEMQIKLRYKEILLLLETCQASTLANYIVAPNITTIASSAKGENSYSYYSNDLLGVSVLDRFAFATKEFFKPIIKSTKKRSKSKSTRSSAPNDANNSKRSKEPLSIKNVNVSIQQYVDSLDRRFLRSTATVIQSPHSRPLGDLLISDFFGSGGSDMTAVVTSSVGDGMDLGIGNDMCSSLPAIASTAMEAVGTNDTSSTDSDKGNGNGSDTKIISIDSSDSSATDLDSSAIDSDSSATDIDSSATDIDSSGSSGFKNDVPAAAYDEQDRILRQRDLTKSLNSHDRLLRNLENRYHAEQQLWNRLEQSLMVS